MSQSEIRDWKVKDEEKTRHRMGKIVIVEVG